MYIRTAIIRYCYKDNNQKNLRGEDHKQAGFFCSLPNSWSQSFY